MAELIKQKLKKIIGLRGTIYFNHFLRRSFSPTSFKSKINPNDSYSDFFFYSSNLFLNTYRSENTFALILKKPFKVRHKFVFYSRSGELFKEIYIESPDFIISVDFPCFETREKYLSFTHEILPLDGNLKLKDIIGQKKLVSFQNRGYTIFKKEKNSIGSSVHGNFGFICPSNIKMSAARQRRIEFSYTPSYEFEFCSSYDLLFNNPTDKSLKVEIKFKNRNFEIDDFNLQIRPMGTDYVPIKKYQGQISFNSNLPICRPLIFKNPELDLNNFDVLHS